MKLTVFLLMAAVALAAVSCDPVRKLAKSKSMADKDSAAAYYFSHKKYDQAVYLYEELMPMVRGTPRAQEIYYNYAYSRYKLGELVSGAFYFDDFAHQYPGSPKAEEALYQGAYAYYLLSDPYYLDQNYTYKAIERLQLFLSRFPYSPHKDDCARYISELRETLARKSFEQANLYYKITYYKAAVQAFQNTIREFPDSKYREESQFLLYKASVRMAQQSIAGRKLKRYQMSDDYYKRFVEKFPSSKFAKEAENLKTSVDKETQKLEVSEEENSEETLFRTFETHIQKALRTEDPVLRASEYEDAMDYYNDLKEKNPASTWLREAEKWFKQWDQKYGSDSK